MINVFQHELLTLGQAGQSLPRPASFCSVYRWAVRGRNGIKLETIVVGNRRYTTRESLQRFFEQLTETENVSVSNPIKAEDRRQTVGQSPSRRTTSPNTRGSRR